MKIELPVKVKLIIDRLREAGYDAFAVGGCVRDSLLNKRPKDWDITSSATPYQVKELFDRTVDTGIVHGTVTVLLGKDGFEVTTYRVDGEYEDNRHPKQVMFTSQLVEDLQRRDFTINAMAYNHIHGLVDAFSGLKDLEDKVIRCVGSAVERFDEDALRILRALRFSAQLDFDIEGDTMEAIKAKAKNLQQISAERIREELTKLLLSDHVEKLKLAYETGITKVVLPEFDQMMETLQENHYHIYTVGEHCLKAVQFFSKKYPLLEDASSEFTKKEQTIIRWALLLHDVAKPRTKSIGQDGEAHFYQHSILGAKLAKEILRGLKFDNETIDSVYQLVLYHDYSYELEYSHMRKAMSRIGIEHMKLLFEVKQADIMAQNPVGQEEKLNHLAKAQEYFYDIIRRGDCINLKGLAVNGKDLIQLGIPSGKYIGEKLNELLELVLENPELNTKEKLLELIR